MFRPDQLSVPMTSTKKRTTIYSFVKIHISSTRQTRPIPFSDPNRSWYYIRGDILRPNSGFNRFGCNIKVVALLAGDLSSMRIPRLPSWKLNRDMQGNRSSELN